MSQPSRFVEWLPAGVVVLLLGVVPLVFLWSSRELSSGAEVMPVGMSLLMLFCLARSFLKNRRGRRFWRSAKAADTTLTFPRLVLVAVGLFLFTPLAEVLGFYASGFVYIVAGYLAFARTITLRAAAWALVTAACFTVCAWYVFYKVLTIMTPTGVLF